MTQKSLARFINSLSDNEAYILFYNWHFWRRKDQTPPPGAKWRTWVLQGGRGGGKNWTGSNYIHELAMSGKFSRISIVGATAADVRELQIEGEAGILNIAPPHELPDYQPSKRKVVWPNGATGILYTGEDPEQTRGANSSVAWLDEFCKYQYPREVWDNIQFGLRLGNHPHAIITTTPKPIPTFKQIVGEDSTLVSYCSTFDNRLNLSDQFFEYVTTRYGNTRLGRQELYAEILDDVPGALWKRELIDSYRVTQVPKNIQRLVVGIDPAMTNTEDSDETGIIVGCIDDSNHVFILRDVSGRFDPEHWISRALVQYHTWNADRIVGEVNNGGDLIEALLRTHDNKAAFKAVRAKRGKYTRAEPIAALYEQGKVHHVGTFAELEDQMCNFVPGEDHGLDDRVDAMVWTITELALTNFFQVF